MVSTTAGVAALELMARIGIGRDQEADVDQRMGPERGQDAQLLLRVVHRCSRHSEVTR